MNSSRSWTSLAICSTMFSISSTEPCATFCTRTRRLDFGNWLVKVAILAINSSGGTPVRRAAADAGSVVLGVEVAPLPGNIVAVKEGKQGAARARLSAWQLQKRKRGRRFTRKMAERAELHILSGCGCGFWHLSAPASSSSS
eukprot:c12713_g1_i2 orf=1-423(-)